ncbi:MAG TPA: ParA family protein [Gammaproteobacteria bacterium]|nr:ParA family protein [Gammaproteobacteria bacterium]
MQRVTVLNAKGGCGKTTLATGLAAYLRTLGHVTALMDYDSQSSSLGWLSRRPDGAPPIYGIPATRPGAAGVTRSWRMRLPPDVERVVIDTPAAMDLLQLQDLVATSDVLLLPILPSPMDIHAASRFIGDLLLRGQTRRHGCRIGVVANRVREHTITYRSLQSFLDTLDIPFVATLHDSRGYLRACESGLGLCEMGRLYTPRDQREWEKLACWLESCRETAAEIP